MAMILITLLVELIISRNKQRHDTDATVLLHDLPDTAESQLRRFHMLRVSRQCGRAIEWFVVDETCKMWDDIFRLREEFPTFLLCCGSDVLQTKKPSLTLNLGTNGLKVTSEPPPTVGQAGCLQGQGRSAVTHPSSSHARRYLIRLSCDNRCTRYTAPLATGEVELSAGYIKNDLHGHSCGFWDEYRPILTSKIPLSYAPLAFIVTKYPIVVP
ncbi:hypothetical protein J6590_044394 [Homalodisca vitripennis]|nr:hypothetical protein J6590_044394 [Homalodisca vitripennis]